GREINDGKPAMAEADAALFVEPIARAIGAARRHTVANGGQLALINARRVWGVSEDCSDSTHRLFARDEMIAENEHVHFRAQETVERFMWSANDRLIFVEGSVEHHGHSGQ